ncbi:hypothetical protein V8F06_012876 [Rhypophila decipiens]
MARHLNNREFEFNASSSEPFGPPNGTFNYTAIWGPITDHRPSRQPSIIASTIFALLVSVIFVILRFHTRRRLKIISPSDWAIILALICSGGVTASAIEQAFRGAGRHAWELDFFGLPALQRAAWYGMLFYGASLSFTRISILLLYRRIFTYDWAKRAIEVSLAVVSILGIWFVISVCTACVPLQAYWQWDLMFRPDGPKVTCLPYQIWWTNAALHLTSDLIIIALPMPILSTLKLPKRQKYALVGVFALGAFVCLISILRLIALIDITFNPGLDGSYTSADLIYWTAAEVNAAIVCACAMTLKPLVQRLFPKLLGGRSGRYGGGNGHSLPWITPITGTAGDGDENRTRTSHSGSQRRSSVRNSLRQSFSWGIGGKANSVRTSIHGGRGHARSGSGASGDVNFAFGSQAKRKGSHASSYSHGFGHGYGGRDLPRVEERELRGQKGREREGADEGDDGDSLLNQDARPRTRGHVAEGGDLAAPPKAHLRLSIHVTRSVHVTKMPSSPVPPDSSSVDGGDEKDEKALDDDGIPPGGLPSSTFGGRMG